MVTMPSLTTTVCPRLAISLQGSLLQILGYRSLVAEVEKFRREAYDSENVHHEEMLMKVQTVLATNPGTPTTASLYSISGLNCVSH